MNLDLRIIAAVAKNGVIGKRGGIPWHIPDDLKRFQELTSGFPVIMGRRTFDSIYGRLGKPLSNRDNIVLTRNKNFDLRGIFIVYSFGLTKKQKHSRSKWLTLTRKAFT